MHYDVILTNNFKKQYKKMKKQANFKKDELEKVIDMLLNNEILSSNYKNHLLNPKSKRYMGVSYSK